MFSIESLRWLAEADLYTYLLRLPVATSRNYWWQQSLDLAAIAFALYLSLVGHRRKMPHLWAYAVVAQIVGLSVAMNMFFLGVIATPIPRPKKVTRQTQPLILSRLDKMLKNVAEKPEGWAPNQSVYIASSFAAFAAIAVTPTAFDTTTFIPVALLSKVLPWLPLALPYIVPTSFGTVHASAANRDRTTTNTFRIISAISFILYAKAMSYAIIYNDPSERYYDPKWLDPLHYSHNRGDWERTSTTVGRIFAVVFGRYSSHPVMTKIGYDVLMTGASLCAWAMIRGTDANLMLKNLGIAALGDEAGKVSGMANGLIDDMEQLAEKAEHGVGRALDNVHDAAKSHSKKFKRSTSGNGERDEEHDQDDHTNLTGFSYADIVKKDAAGTIGGHKDSMPKPSESSEPLYDSDASFADVVKKGSAARRASKGRKSSSGEHTDEQEKKGNKKGGKEDKEDKEYKPSHKGEESKDEADEINEELDSEAAALTWGVFAIGGLSAAASAVLGAESIRG